jgi:hypothetical protein
MLDWLICPCTICWWKMNVVALMIQVDLGLNLETSRLTTPHMNQRLAQSSRAPGLATHAPPPSQQIQSLGMNQSSACCRLLGHLSSPQRKSFFQFFRWRRHWETQREYPDGVSHSVSHILIRNSIPPQLERPFHCCFPFFLATDLSTSSLCLSICTFCLNICTLCFI